MDYSTLNSLVTQGLSIREIGDHLGIAYSSVRYWLRKHSLKTRRGPHGEHPKDFSVPRRCACGETDPTKFYGNKRRTCGACHNRKTIEKGREKRDFMIEFLGGCCKFCGFSKYRAALDVHHLDPSEKDPSASSMRSWSLARIKKELSKCVLACKNCHAAIHAGELEQKREVA